MWGARVCCTFWADSVDMTTLHRGPLKKVPFLPRDALVHSAVLRLLSSVRLSVRLSVCPSVTIRYREDIGWNSSKITSRPNNLRPLLWCNGNMGIFGGD